MERAWVRFAGTVSVLRVTGFKVQLKEMGLGVQVFRVESLGVLKV